MKNGRYLILLFFVFFLSPSFTNLDKNGWELDKVKDGIYVYVRIREGFSVKEIRVVDTVKSSLSGIVTLLLDSKNYPNWVYACKKAQTIRNVSEFEIYQYQIISVPLPFQNRDIILNLKISQDIKSKAVTTESISHPEFMPANEGVERINYYKSSYVLTPLRGQLVKVEFEMHMEPGGNIPSWLINSTIIRGPFATAVAMREELKKTQYQKAVFSNIIELK